MPIADVPPGAKSTRLRGSGAFSVSVFASLTAVLFV
jgi:hypothetical protein